MRIPIKRSIAFWISPQGQTHRVRYSHIEHVIDNPELFDVCVEELKELYRKYSEPWRCEGRAREVTIRALIDKGWIRVRRYKHEYAVNVATIENPTLNTLARFARQILGEGFEGMYEQDKLMPLNIRPLGLNAAADPNEQFSVTLEQISSCPETAE